MLKQSPRVSGMVFEEFTVAEALSFIFLFLTT